MPHESEWLRIGSFTFTKATQNDSVFYYATLNIIRLNTKVISDVTCFYRIRIFFLYNGVVFEGLPLTLSAISGWGSYRYLKWLGRSHSLGIGFGLRGIWKKELSAGYLCLNCQPEFGTPTSGWWVVVYFCQPAVEFLGVVSLFFFPLLVIWGGDLGAEQRSEFSDLLYSYFIPVLDIQKYKERIFEAFTIKTSCACAFVLFLLLFFSF